jgi:hypothetical protein
MNFSFSRKVLSPVLCRYCSCVKKISASVIQDKLDKTKENNKLIYICNKGI